MPTQNAFLLVPQKHDLSQTTLVQVHSPTLAEHVAITEFYGQIISPPKCHASVPVLSLHSSTCSCFEMWWKWFLCFQRYWRVVLFVRPRAKTDCVKHFMTSCWDQSQGFLSVWNEILKKKEPDAFVEKQRFNVCVYHIFGRSQGREENKEECWTACLVSDLWQSRERGLPSGRRCSPAPRTQGEADWSGIPRLLTDFFSAFYFWKK